MKRFLIPVALLALVVGGCGGGLAEKTAKDLEVAAEMILPDYLRYVEADPKLDAGSKRDRENHVRAFRDVLKAAQRK